MFMAGHLLGLQIKHIKKHHGSTDWLIIDRLLPFLDAYKPMRTDLVEGVMVYLMFLVDQGWTNEQISFVVDPMAKYPHN